MNIRSWAGEIAGLLASFFLIVLLHTSAAAQAVTVPAELCAGLSQRLDQMTSGQVSLMTAVPASARVWSRCKTLLKDDVVAGQKCVNDICAEVDREGIVERRTGSLDDRLSTCARATIDLVRLSRFSELLTVSYSKVCPGTRAAVIR